VVGLKFAGLGGSVTDVEQDRLRSKMCELTAGDLSRPIVAVGWNSERFDGCNLALRLVALGYAQVYWYRGGREAWEVADLPETDMAMQNWQTLFAASTRASAMSPLTPASASSAAKSRLSHFRTLAVYPMQMAIGATDKDGS
jgi:hypothetical protein